MPFFRYVAIFDGRKIRGVIEADDQSSAVTSLRDRRHLLLQIAPARNNLPAFPSVLAVSGLSRTVGGQPVADTIRELSIMLRAGQDLDRALRFLIETDRRRLMVDLLTDVRNKVRNGGTLAQALVAHPNVFSGTIVGLVQAGEAGGDLAGALERLATLLERQRALVNTVRTALIYPTLLIVASIGSIAFLLTEILPQFIPLFQESGVTLPLPTRLLIGLGDMVSHWGGWALLLFLLAGFGLQQALKKETPRRTAERLLFRLPLIAPLTREILAARMTRTLGSLLMNGVPLANALPMTRDAIGFRTAEQVLDAALVGARGGAGLAASLATHTFFPLRTIHLLQLGEETAQLGPMALRAADIHEEKAQQTIQRLLALLTPTVTLIMGLVVAAIVTSLLLAMLSINDLAG